MCLQGVADNLLALIRLCFDKEKEKHHRTSELLDLENFNLLRLLRAAENKCELKDCLLLEAKTKNSEYGKTVVEGKPAVLNILKNRTIDPSR